SDLIAEAEAECRILDRTGERRHRLVFKAQAQREREAGHDLPGVLEIEVLLHATGGTSGDVFIHFVVNVGSALVGTKRGARESAVPEEADVAAARIEGVHFVDRLGDTPAGLEIMLASPVDELAAVDLDIGTGNDIEPGVLQARNIRVVDGLT